MSRLVIASCFVALPLAVALHASSPAEAAAAVDRVADEFLAAVLAEQPEQAYFAGIRLERHDGLSDNRPEAVAAWRAREDAWLAALDAIDADALAGTPQRIAHGVLREQLAAAVGTRICRGELWQGVNQMGSWHTAWATVAELQPVGTAEERAQALVRWRKTPEYVRTEIVQLRRGLAAGYSAARPVAGRMLKQIDGLLAIPLADHPYLAPARRTDDAAFRAELEAVVAEGLLPAMRDFRAFLAGDYLEAARREIALSALPDGAACYDALLRSYTTLARPAAEVAALGERVVATSGAEAVALGRALYGTSTLPELMARLAADESNRYPDADAVLADSRRIVERAQAAMPRYFGRVPDLPVVVEPIPAYEDGAGASSHYKPPQPDGTPGKYMISLLRPGGTTRSEAEIVAFHETWPGHHLHFAYSQRIAGLHPALQLVWNSGFVEGWGRYAEALAEEAGLYASELAKIQRRAWPARGMVVDSGIHVLGWTRERAVDFILESGRYTVESANDTVDRIAAIPGQLTAYDSGAQEIFALRREAAAALGDRFDLAAFHDALLGDGIVPLPMVRQAVERWIVARRGD
jgi:uncharacterized protein (DUF885 family)